MLRTERSRTLRLLSAGNMEMAWRVWVLYVAAAYASSRGETECELASVQGECET